MFDLKKISGATRTSLVALGFVASSIALTGCDLTRNQMKTDRAAHLEFQDFRDSLASRLPMAEQQAESGTDSKIPSLQPYVAQPSENLQPMPLVSIAVNQTVPLRDALFELAKQANYDVELDPRITGSIIFTAKEKPFDLVIKRIAEISGLRYKFTDDVLRVELDTPYTKTYKIDYLSFVRRNTSSIRNDIAVVTGSGTNTGSGFEAANESEANFWAELETNLTQILGVTLSRGGLKTAADPQITAVQQNPAPVEPVVVEGEAGGEGAPVIQTQAPQATLQVNSLPSTDPNAAATNQYGRTQDQDPTKASFSINKQSGMVSVYASERQHEEIREYMTELKRSSTAQVLIEAKIMEVSLSDEYNTGIDWSRVAIGDKATLLDIALPIQPFLDADAAPTNGVAFTMGGSDVSVVINALSQFGTVRALASPRLTVLNNQSAALNVAQNLVYFEVEIETSQSQSSTTTNIDSEIRNVPEGILINVQPSINLDDKTVSMAIRPTITNVEQFQSDPAVEIQAAALGVNVTSNVPVVQVQEFDSVISMNSGQAMLMGGLMQDRERTTEQGVPILSEVPFIGEVFQSHVDHIQKTELVVFLKATIVEGGNNIHNTDRELYKMFSQDRRPLDL